MLTDMTNSTYSDHFFSGRGRRTRPTAPAFVWCGLRSPFSPLSCCLELKRQRCLARACPFQMTAARSVVFVKVRFGSTRTEEDVPATRVADRHLSIYWRMLRPEFVKGDAETMTYRVRKYKQVREKLKRSRRVVYICTVFIYVGFVVVSTLTLFCLGRGRAQAYRATLPEKVCLHRGRKLCAGSVDWVFGILVSRG